MNSSTTGYISELTVQLAARRHGWLVYTDPTNSSACDMIFGLGTSLVKIQVKTVGNHPTTNKVVSVTRGKADKSKSGRRQARKYRPTDFDFLIATDGTDFWIFPMSLVQEYATSITISIMGKTEPYRNAWHLIEAEASRRATAAMLGAADAAAVEEALA